MTDAATIAAPGATMRAITYDRYGSPDVLRLSEVPVPSVADGNLLVRVGATSVNALDWHMLRGKPYVARLSAGLTKPKKPIPCVDVAGTVVAVGSEVTGFAVGDRVFANKGRAAAEYVSGPASLFVPMPSNLSMEEAAAIPAAGITALQAIRDRGLLQAGQSVLVHGAGGGVGTFSVQIAKALGGEVTGVTRTENLELVRSIGADRVVDYSASDVTRSGERYDLVIDNGATRPLLSMRRLLKPSGRLVTVGASRGAFIGPVVRIVAGGVVSRFGGPAMIGFFAEPKREDLLVLKDLAESGALTSVIDRTYPLRKTAEALAYLETMRARGKVVVTI
ncbi:MAG TPA: NAD(P)-dependent alcohol dehydrogenase [Candidatus Limnocylindria bacterium]|jgi:NADPH:quinone reductase-like Zn-dependent oxidoreductase